MPIVFSAVSCARNIVANFASCDGNFTEIAEQVLSKLPPCNNKMTYSHGIYLLHYISEDDCLYFCITDKLCQRSRAFLFLNEIQRRFVVSKRAAKDFTTVLAAEMYRYSEDYSTIVIRKGELDELNTIGVGCSESILGEKILYINNPDIISYSTISHVSATPGLVSVSGVSPISEEMSVVTPISQRTSIMNPTANRISDMRQTPERVSAEHTTEQRTSEPTALEEEINIVSSVELGSPDNILAGSPVSEETVLTTHENSTFNRTAGVSPNPTTHSIPAMTPRLYVIIIGMIMLVIAMSVCALGPISCVVVTTVGVYSLLRYYAGSKDKTE